MKKNKNFFEEIEESEIFHSEESVKLNLKNNTKKPKRRSTYNNENIEVIEEEKSLNDEEENENYEYYENEEGEEGEEGEEEGEEGEEGEYDEELDKYEEISESEMEFYDNEIKDKKKIFDEIDIQVYKKKIELKAFENEFEMLEKNTIMLNLQIHDLSREEELLKNELNNLKQSKIFTDLNLKRLIDKISEEDYKNYCKENKINKYDNVNDDKKKDVLQKNILFDIKLACMLYFLEFLKNKFKYIYLNDIKVSIKELNYHKKEGFVFFNIENEYEELVYNQTEKNLINKSPENFIDNDLIYNPTYEILISHEKNTITYYFESEGKNKDFKFIDLKAECFKEFKISSFELKNYCLMLDDMFINNEDFVLDFIKNLREFKEIIRFDLQKKIEYGLKNFNKRKENETVKKKKKKFEETGQNYYFSEIAYLEADLKLQKIKQEQELFKNKKGKLFNKLEELEVKHKEECVKKAKELNIRNKNFLDFEDKYINIKETCYEIQALEIRKKSTLESIVRLDKIKKDNPILISYKDVFRFRLFQAIYFFIYLFCLLFFMMKHRFSSLDDSIDSNMIKSLENFFFKNALFKHFFRYIKNRKSVDEETQKDFFFNHISDFYLYESVIFNNIFTEKEVNQTSKINNETINIKNENQTNNTNSYNQTSNKTHQNKIIRNKDKNETNIRHKKRNRKRYYGQMYVSSDKKAPYQSQKLAEFNHKFSKRYYFEDLEKNDESLKIDYESYQNLKDLFIRDIDLSNGISLDLSHSLSNSDKRDLTYPIKINISDDYIYTCNITNPEDEYIKKIIPKNNFKTPIWDCNNSQITFSFDDSMKNETSYLGEIHNYLNTGYFFMYNFSDHHTEDFYKISNQILKNIYKNEDLRFSSIEFFIKHRSFDIIIRIKIVFEITHLGFTNFDYSIDVLDFDKNNNFYTPTGIVYLLSVYSLYLILLYSFIKKAYTYLKFKNYRIYNNNTSPIIIDLICLIIIAFYEILFQMLKRSQLNNGVDKQSDSFIFWLRFIKIAKAFLTFLLTIRLFVLLKQSFLINFFVRLFKNFYARYINIYSLAMMSIFCISLFFFTNSKNIVISSVTESMFIIRKSMYDSIESKAFRGISDRKLLLNMIFLMLIKTFVFSIIIAGLKELYDHEIKNYDIYIRKFKKKLLGDYLFFLVLFIPKVITGYIFYEYERLKKIDEEILAKIKIGLKNIEGTNEEYIANITSLADLTKQQIEIFYSYFHKDQSEYNFVTIKYFNDLLDSYSIEKIGLNKRDVYIIVENNKSSKFRGESK